MRLRNLSALMSNAAAKSARVYAPRGSRTIARAGREQVPKTLALADGLGSLVRFASVLGQRGEITGAEKSIEGYLLAPCWRTRLMTRSRFAIC